MTTSPPSGAPSATAGARSVALRSGVYADSVRLMQVSRQIQGLDGVTAVLVAMATPLNLELAEGMGLAPDEGASPEQLLIAVPDLRMRDAQQLYLLSNECRIEPVGHRGIPVG